MSNGRSRVVLVSAIVGALACGLLATTAQAGSGARLVIHKLSNPPAEAVAGDGFEVSGKVKNVGRKSAKGRVTAELDPESGGDDVALGSTVTERIKPGKKARFSIDAQIPADLGITEPTTYELVACVRPHGKKGSTRCEEAKREITVSPAHDFQPGARTLGDELFPQIGNGGYDAGHYLIELDYDPVANEFLAGTKTTINAMATQDLSEFSLDFQDIPVSAVTVNGEAADSFEQVDAEPPFDPVATQPMKLVVDPATDIPNGTSMEIVVEYAGTPVQVTDADTSLEGWIPACYPLAPPQTCDGAFVVNEPIGAQGWFPSNNFPTDKATFETRVTVPESYEAVGIGELVSNDATAGDRTWIWSEDDPTSTYLTTATVGQFDFTERDITEALTGTVLPQFEFIDSSSTTEQKDAINASLARTEEMTNFLAERFGAYPYDSGGAVADRAAGVGYALEVATRPHYSGGFTTGNPSIGQGTLLHEISHQWMGNSVTLANWKDIWFQEGWAQWVTWSWNFHDGTSNGSPASQWDSQYTDGDLAKWDTIPTELNNNPADLFANFPTYVRGAMTYEGYRQIVGGPKFFDFARELTSRFAYGNVSSEDVVDLAIEISGFEGDDLALLEDYFQQWLYEAGRPTITADDFT
jgi:Peptidase family M1 domain/Peptidase M1 N-terminal domain